ncbi:MAG: hypothetical protein HQL25_05315 [Candidatus Omnitrophica bacterium]|nr:hypothetical protein [Candidatus Omnitrophota bacterium]
MVNNKMNNSSGKILVIFLVIAAVLLTSLAAISTFLFQKEIEKRKSAEDKLNVYLKERVTVTKDLEQLQKEKQILQEKNKEADDKINGLLDELELQEGLRKEIKNESASLREQLDSAKKDTEKLNAKVAELQEAAQKYEEIKNTFETQKKQKEDLDAQLKTTNEHTRKLESTLVELERKILEYDPNFKPSTGEVAKIAKGAEQIALDTIVVAPQTIPEGRVLAVDTDAEFLILNLGEKDGVKAGTIMSVYRGKDYLGDVKITRIQPEMSAADFIPPFSSKLVRKNDQVVVK